MPDNVFIDSNIIIYAYSVDEAEKQAIVKGILNAHDVICISTQTINEFVNVTMRKKMLDSDSISAVVEELFSILSVKMIDQNIIESAIIIAKNQRYSYFDSLMLASALASDCSVLYSEDMHHGHLIDGKLKIINPFHT